METFRIINHLQSYLCRCCRWVYAGQWQGHLFYAVRRGYQSEDIPSYLDIKTDTRVRRKFTLPCRVFFGSLTADDLSRKGDNVANGIEPVRGPIGDVTGMEAEFKLLTTRLAFSQQMPYDLSFDAQLRGQWSSGKKLPQAYEFIGADNGSNGFALDLALSRQILVENLRFGVAYSVTKATSYFRDPEQAQAPGCLEDGILPRPVRVGTRARMTNGGRRCPIRETKRTSVQRGKIALPSMHRAMRV